MRALVALSLLALGAAGGLTWLRVDRGARPPELPASPVPAASLRAPEPPPAVAPSAPEPPAAAAPPAAEPTRSRELLRYATRDGRFGMTDDAARVPAGATILGRASVSEPPAPPTAEPTPPVAIDAPVARVRSAQRPAPAEAALEAEWRERVRQVQNDLARARVDTATAERAVQAECRRVTDYDGSIHRSGACGLRKEELRMARERQATIREYMTEGMPDECRRAGCLPGWIREAEEDAGPDPLADADRDGYDADGDGFDHDPDVESSDG